MYRRRVVMTASLAVTAALSADSVFAENAVPEALPRPDGTIDVPHPKDGYRYCMVRGTEDS